MDLQEEWGERDAPAWAAEPIAWCACLAYAALPTAVLDAALRFVKVPTLPAVTFALYICAFALLALVLKPWSAR